MFREETGKTLPVHARYPKGFKGTSRSHLKASRHFLPLLGAFLILFILAGCRAAGNSDNLLVFGMEANPTNLDPRLATDSYSSQIDQLLFDQLVRINDRFEAQPELAERWEMAAEDTYVMHLRRGVLFHNGRELTSADVKYTFESILDPAFGSPKRGDFQELKSISAPDRYTVIFQLKRPFAPFLTALATGIVPEAEAKAKGQDFGVHPIGCGPFQLTEYVPGQRYTTMAWDKYWGGRVKLDGIKIRVIPDATVRLMELKQGEVDLVINAVEPDLVAPLAAEQKFRVQKTLGTSYSYLGFNLDDPVLKDARVRQAIAHAINRPDIIKYILGGDAREAAGLLAPNHWAYAGDVETFKYDPEAARRLLTAAGYPEKPNGQPRLKLSFKTSTNELRRRIAEVLKEQLRQVGIELSIQSLEWGTFFGDIKNGNFQLYTLTWVGVTDPDMFYYIYNSASIPPAGANRGRYRNAEVDRLTEAARFTLDKEKRRELYRATQKILARDLPCVSLWYTVNVAVMKSRVENFQLSPSVDFFPLRKVSLKQPAK